MSQARNNSPSDRRSMELHFGKCPENMVSVYSTDETIFGFHPSSISRLMSLGKSGSFSAGILDTRRFRSTVRARAFVGVIMSYVNFITSCSSGFSCAIRRRKVTGKAYIQCKNVVSFDAFPKLK